MIPFLGVTAMAAVLRLKLWASGQGISCGRERGYGILYNTERHLSL